MSCKSVKPCYTSSLERSIGHKFDDITFLKEALRHSSFVNEHPEFLKDNECLEFLGDAILNFVISDLLIQYYPDLDEGDLSRMRASLVNEVQLSIIAKSVKLGSYLHLGKGEEKTDGRRKNSILANALEAVIAAVYRDGGTSSSFALIKDLFSSLIKVADTANIVVDYKSRLQEKVQPRYHMVPCYVVANEHGPDHNKLFKVKMTIGNVTSFGEGCNKKAAEQAAAKKGLKLLLEKSQI